MKSRRAILAMPSHNGVSRGASPRWFGREVNRPRGKGTVSRMRVIVVGVDGSPGGEHALWYAAGLAGRQGLELVAVYVRRAAAHTFADLVAGPVGCEPRDEQELRSLDATRDACEEAGARWSFVVRQGAAAEELHAVAAERRASLIVVGTRGDSIAARLRRIAHGSVSTRLVRREPLPVLVVR